MIQITNTSRGVHKGDWAKFVKGHNSRLPEYQAAMYQKKLKSLAEGRWTGPDYEKRDCGYTTQCWYWLKSKTDQGYGRKGSALAHRAYFERHVRPLAPGEVVMHLCDNPSCVNPKHLQAGTQRENLLDALHKGRSPHPMTGSERIVLTKRQIQKAIVMRKQGLSYGNIAKKLGCSQTAAWDAVNDNRLDR